MTTKTTTTTMERYSNNRVLSIQSHVVHGYVGNKAAVFPLQLLGFDVDVINSVHFSNHTGHPHGYEGNVLDGDELRSVCDGLKRNNLLSDIGHLLTGYIGSESFLRAILEILHTLRSIPVHNNSNNNNRQQRRRRAVRYVCDPVLGDNGQFYVPPSLVPIYRNEVLPLADVVTPNQFEVEQLTGITLRTIDDACKACNALHELGPQMVFITSIVLTNNNDDTTLSPLTEKKIDKSSSSIAIIASRRRRQQQQQFHDIWRIDTPFIEGHFTGTGDLCAALLLAWTTIDGDHDNDNDEDASGDDDNDHDLDLSLILEKVVGSMYAVIKRTQQKFVQSTNNDDGRYASDEGTISTAAATATSGGNINNEMKLRELQLIQSKADIESPPIMFKAHRIL